MRVLLIGGTGLISTGIIKHLLARRAEVTMFNRGRRPSTLPPEVRHLIGDRNEPGFAELFESKPFDVVIDMICFNPDQAEASVRAFSKRCEHFIFCSTVCTYGIKIPPTVLIDESFPQEPISAYGKNKLACEQIFRRADASGSMNVTIIRPSHTYGPGSPMIDNLEPDSVAWDRIEHGLPVLCSGDGLGLWMSTHRDDCGKLFAYAANNPAAFGKSYNATNDRVFTWRDYYREAAAALGKKARLLFMPADWIVAHDPSRFGVLKEIFQYHGAYTSATAKRDIPEFRCEISFRDGVMQTLADARDRGAWRTSKGDLVYETMVEKALNLGIETVEA